MDEDTEAGGQTDDSGDTGGEDEEPAEPDREASTEGGEKPAKPPRAQRRQHVMREAKIAREAAERERDEWRQRASSHEAQLAELRTRLEERERSTQVQDKNAERKARIQSLREQAKAQLFISAQSKDAAAANEAWKKHQELNDEADDLRDEMRWEKRRGELPQQNNGFDPAVLEEKMYISAKYPFLETSIEAQHLADGRYIALTRAGRPRNRATLEEAITWAAQKIGVGGGSTGPNTASRQRYVGMGQRDGEQDDGGSSGTMSAEEVKSNIAFKRMALGAYPQLDPEQAYAKWARDIGSKAKNGNAG